MRDSEVYPILERQFGPRAAKPKLYREGLVRDGIMEKALRGRFGYVELPLSDVAMLAMAMAASETASHAPLAARRYVRLRANPAEPGLIKQPDDPEALPDVLSGLRDDDHALPEVFERLFRAFTDRRNRYRLGRAFRLTISREFPSAELTVRHWRSGTAFRRRYTVRGSSDLMDLATMPGTDPHSGVSFPCVLNYMFFAALGAALEESEQKRAAAEPRPNRRKQVGREVIPPANDPRGCENKSGDRPEQPATDLHESHHFDDEDRAGCVKRSPSPRAAAL